jgi:hypothetical protein
MPGVLWFASVGDRRPPPLGNSETHHDNSRQRHKRPVARGEITGKATGDEKGGEQDAPREED